MKNLFIQIRTTLTHFIIADDKEAPRWLHLANAVAVVVYVNLDCIDGKQVSVPDGAH